MTKYLFTLFILMISAGFGSGLENKVYIEQDNLHLNENGIFIQIYDDWVQLDQINHDSNGFFVSKDINSASFFWNCPKCHYDNNFWVKKCAQCGYEPRKNRS